MLHTSVTLSRSTYALTWTAEQIGDQHEALYVPPDTASPDRLVAATRLAGNELGGLGLFTPQDGVHPDLLAVLRVLARPEVEVFGTLADQQRPEPVSVVAAAAGGTGVLAVLDATTLGLHPVRPDAVNTAMLSLLSPTPPGHGQSMTVPASAVDRPPAGCAGGGEDFSVFAGQGRTDPTVARLRHLVAQPRSGGAQLFVAARDSLGRRRRGEFAVNVIDVQDGRWFVHRQRNAAGDVWITAAPATTEVLAARLYDIWRGLAATR